MGSLGFSSTYVTDMLLANCSVDMLLAPLTGFPYAQHEKSDKPSLLAPDCLNGDLDAGTKLRTTAGLAMVLMHNIVPMFWSTVHDFGLQDSPAWKSLKLVAVIGRRSKAFISL